MSKKIIILFILIFFNNNIDANSKENSRFFDQGKKDFEKGKYHESKINFEKNIVRNPKDFKSYLYLSKIYKIKKINDEYELYNVNSHEYMYFKDETTMIGLIQSKALYNQDEIHFRKELKRKNTILYQKIQKCFQCVGKFFTDILK